MRIESRIDLMNRRLRFSLKSFWWVFVLLAGNYCCFAFLKSSKSEEIALLKMKKQDLLLQRQKLEMQKQNLLLHIQSQSDSSWIELVLMKELGVVPDKHIKVYFTKEE